MRGHVWLAASWSMLLAIGARASTDTSVLEAAEDAFGVTLGSESLGLYSSYGIRGFNPISAGNARINGLYFDQQGQMMDRLVTHTRIRVGLSAVDFPWPAPTGIVDYALRAPKDVRGLTAALYTGPYGSRELDVDGYRRLSNGHAGIAAGASYRWDEDLPGLTTRIASVAVLPQWTPNEQLTIQTFWGRLKFTDDKPMPAIYVAANQMPPPVPRRYFGQRWTEQEYRYEHYGIAVDARSSGPWLLRAGLFRSVNDSPRSFADLYVNTSSNALASHLLVAEPDQYYGSTSGEIRLARTVVGRSWLGELDLGLRGRRVSARYGGSDVIDLGIGRAGEVEPLSRPAFAFHARTADHIQQYSLAISCNFQWRKRLDFTAGIQRPSYSRDVMDPVLGSSTRSEHPWLYNASIALRPSEHITLFGTLTRGLEDSGVAPGNAINRGAILGAVRSSQEEAGVKYAFGSSLTLVAAAFDVRKPYFALDTHGAFGSLGWERHRGGELSLAGELIAGLKVVAGAVIMSPEVVGVSPEDPIGRIPIGQPRAFAQIGLDYRIPRLSGLTLDCSFSARGARMARADNRVAIPGYGTMDVGVRYRIGLASEAVTLRVQGLNVTDRANWAVAVDGALEPVEPRRWLAYVVVDL